MARTSREELHARRPRQDRSRATVSAIEQAIDEVVADAGLNGVTWKAVATRAGVGPATLHRYFGSRDALLVSWEHRMRKRCSRELGRAIALAVAEHDDVEHVVRGVARRFVRTLHDQTRLGRSDVFHPSPERTYRLQFVEKTIAVLIRLLARAEGREARHGDLARAMQVSVYAIFFTAYPLALTKSGVEARDAFADQLAEMVTRTLLPPPRTAETGATPQRRCTRSAKPK